MRAEWGFIEGVESAALALALAPTDGRDLSAWITDLLASRGLQRNEVIRSSRLNQTFAYQVIAGTRHASRDKLIQLAFGLGLRIDEACELLERGGSAALLPACPRDVIIAYSLENGHTIADCDDLLWSSGERTLVSPGPLGGI